MDRAMPPFDEGFSEEINSQIGNDSMAKVKTYHPQADPVVSMLYALQEGPRSDAVLRVLPTFSTRVLYEFLEKISSLVYFDPVSRLPHEMILEVFSHLTAQELLTASVVSRSWREVTKDEQLWHDNFGREGWRVDRARIREMGELATKKGVQVAERILKTGQTRPTHSLERKSSRKRARDEAFSESEATQAAGSGSTADVDPVDANQSDASGSMEGVESTANTIRSTNGNIPGTTISAKDFDTRPTTPAVDSAVDSPTEHSSALVQFKPTVFNTQKDTKTSVTKVSWPWLYKQRRRLERNWDTGTYTMFRLPHPEHEAEGHTECVYTIQHSGNHLVSGSRDKTIRIWDLNTQRMRGTPLIGHEASVLCLQFDPRPDEKHDIIVSGGSDNYIIIWKFSTGEKMRLIHNGHTESVLNLRFDDRYLVTCSKDKTIKIWNRHDIAQNDSIIPTRVIDTLGAELNLRENDLISAYSPLDTLVGHQAAVNAVQINGDVIVSASGDRTIKSWNIHTKKPGPNHRKSYTGHTKGIACVQFDGRRIVSGSSDNSVRIFDFETTAEVACLDGHSNLVRTVQARFGDMDTVTDEELLDEAKMADRNFLMALDNGMQPADVSRRRRPRNAGSSRPQDMLSYGTKIPPGGGGSKWAKIVSGSYDETIIIWKRDPSKRNTWKPNQRLHQGQFGVQGRVRANAVRIPHAAHHGNAQAPPQHGQQQNATHQATQLLQQAHGHLAISNALLAQPGVGPGHGLPHSQLTAMAAAQVNLNQHIQVIAGQQQHPQALNAVNTAAAHNNAHAAIATQAIANQAVNAQQAQAGPAQPHGQQQPQQGQAAQNAAQPAAQAVQGQGQAAAQPAGPAQPQAPQLPGQPHHHHHHHHHVHGQAQRGESNRVFKLQFDTRRIIACSQNKVIVGWDFAAGDKDLEWVGDWSIETD
ncbi:Beta-TrCP [Pseudocercospora fuligena]|uniref:Beta-TrCP n=1 Tax=Pseudocercospora fuligena TaxID=685502 RepID=A0A8H6RS90_9PEZI|nr:Beta-TrCP [Pseudocercospora fuligena]